MALSLSVLSLPANGSRLGAISGRVFRDFNGLRRHFRAIDFGPAPARVELPSASGSRSCDKISIGCDTASRNPIVKVSIIRGTNDLDKAFVLLSFDLVSRDAARREQSPLSSITVLFSSNCGKLLNN